MGGEEVQHASLSRRMFFSEGWGYISTNFWEP